MDEVKKEAEVLKAEVVDEFDPLARWIEWQKWLHMAIKKEA